ncbi:MAG: Ni/Fe-hydrogenase, b-type cytochrome subunit [Nitrospinae bacterium]|nr:Ni/Fe-hydrogenase, b-type cytochrome subunit [Nitrospinota bacterium]
MATAAKRGDDTGEIYLVVQTRSVLACVLHWILFLSVVILVITGLYIADPEYYFGKGEAWQAFSMANVRMYHFLAACFMIASVFTRFYLAFTPSCNRDIWQFLPTPKNIVAAVKLAIFYLTLRGEHAHYRFVNPLGGLGIFMISLLILIQVITGIIMYSHGANPAIWGFGLIHSPEDALGGQQAVRMIHHLTLYALMFLVVIHVYTQIWKNSVFTEADIASIIAGYKVFPYKELGHFADIYGIEHEKIPSMEVLDKASTEMPEGPGQKEEESSG